MKTTDYIQYLHIIKKKSLRRVLIEVSVFVGSVVCFILGLQSPLNMTWEQGAFNVVGVLGLVFGFLSNKTLIDKFINLRSGVYIGDSERTHLLISKVQPSELEVMNGYVKESIRLKRNEVVHIFRSDKIDQLMFSEADWPVAQDIHKIDHVRNFVREEKYNLLTFLTKNERYKELFNEEKISLVSDISIKMTKVICARSTYFDSYVTNEVVGKALRSSKNEKLIFDGSSILPLQKIAGKKEMYILKALAENDLNNHIGISTLVFTKDNYFIIWKQGRNAAVNSGKLVPTGSGSSNWSDIDFSSFKKTISRGMIRELREESNMEFGDDETNIRSTKILGYFRWLSRGGKPEFVGITRIDKLHNELRANKDEVHEPDVQNFFYVNSLDMLSQKLSQLINQEDSISLSLAVLIDCFNRHLKENRKALESFLELN